MRNRIRICGEWWKLRKADAIGSHAVTRGYTDGEEREIVYDKDKFGREDLLHEIVHAIEYSFNLSFTEEEVQVVARGLWAVFQDNPWVLEEMKGGT